MTPLEYIAKTYGVPAKHGQRIEYTGGPEPRQGVIVGAVNSYLRIRFDGEAKTHNAPFHPTWKIRYLD